MKRLTGEALPDIARRPIVENDHFIGPREVEHYTRSFLDHIGVKVVRPEQSNPPLEFLTLFVDFGLDGFGLLDLCPKLEKRQHSLISLHHVVREVGQQDRADNRPEGEPCAVANFIDHSHAATESQAESHRQPGICL